MSVCRPFARPVAAAFLIALTPLAACSTREAPPVPAETNQKRAEVEAALQRYQAAARLVDPDSIASFFTSTGILFEPGINPVQGKNAVRAFVASFAGARVDSATATPDTVQVFGNTAYVWGSYFERLSFPGQPDSEQHGKFVAQWTREGNGQWLIERLFRVPIPSPAAGTPGTGTAAPTAPPAPSAPR